MNEIVYYPYDKFDKLKRLIILGKATNIYKDKKDNYFKVIEIRSDSKTVVLEKI